MSHIRLVSASVHRSLLLAATAGEARPAKRRAPRRKLSADMNVAKEISPGAGVVKLHF